MTAMLLGRPHAFERGDKVYLTTPITLATPSEQQIEEYAFASAVKSMAPNEHIGWLAGKYVESGKGNLNNAMWLSDELAIKAVTPMLMPVTVMHDPRTAVGTIADCKLIGAESANSRIDTILAIWKHRFSDIWEEAEANIKDGSMMQSMECLSPWYTCSECGQQFIKLHEGKEQASWCDHLRHNSSRRILGDVCFTGTGLIFGSRGGRGAYTEAHLDHFQDEVAAFHEKAHVDGNYSPERSASQMGFVQIDETELANLRRERDERVPRTELTAEQEKVRDLTTKAETAEASATKEKERADGLEKEKKDLEDKASATQLKDKRWTALGAGFTAKLGDVTKGNLQESASALSDEAWDARLKEVEELTGVKRDASESASGKSGDGKDDSSTDEKAGTSFTDEELASFVQKGVTAPAGTPAPTGGASAARALARTFKQSRTPAKAETK